MFGKCLKHEFRATKRQLVPLFIAMLGVGLLGGLFMLFWIRSLISGVETTFSALGGLFSLLLFLGLFGLMIAVEVVVFVMIIRRFYTSFFTDEGYLSFTLPVTTTQHILSKFVVASVWQVISAVISLFAVGLVLLGALIGVGSSGEAMDAITSTGEGFTITLEEIGSMFNVGSAFLPTITVLYALIIIVGIASYVFLLYFSISLGCMLAKKHRVLAGILSYYIVSGIFSALSSGIQTVIQIVSLSNESLDTLLIGHLAIALVITIIQLIVCYIGTKWILSKKLNLD